MAEPNFDRLFTELNARQMRADRAADRLRSGWWILPGALVGAAVWAGLVFAAVQ